MTVPVEDKPAADRRIVAAATMIGSTIEWYDFFIFGTAAALVFNKLFFPSFDPLVGTLAAFGTFAVGMFARPLGAILFGHYGDRLGRKSMLTITMLMMGIPTVGIGLVPTYESIGPWAAVILIFFRLLQGIAVGGEWGGAALMAVEHAPEGKRSLFGCLPQIGSPAGLLLATLVFALVSQLPQESFMSWGWRVPFLLSVLLIGVGIFVRMRVPESPIFAKAMESGKRVTLPARDVLLRHFKPFMLTVGLKLPEVTMFYLLAVFLLSYGVQIGVSRQVVLNGMMIGAVVECCAILLFGMMADRFGQKKLAVIGGLFIALFAFPMFWLIQTGAPALIALAMAAGFGLGHGLIFGAEPSLVSAQFPTEVRYSGISIGIQVSGAIGGGLAPIVAASILAATGSTHMISVYIAVLGLIAAGCAYAMRPVSDMNE